mmetsp:Transcript_30498/g.50526  ORF Transcript_30498/g.50526 Transcript_30498/m.50526 type:complete len:428 (-) Transcript_30498:356-1639(-)|eukprot:CAMPEP_0119330694 /NCGR_PEP_ID=MMETSP1333-20130426/78779_1 /TAXON_ID=418940 /ORGANISM="Scyphosphaera apsteinii, Strain RCC1455" /LENGTH=427 /DNA_ID=CAMNT_0007340121 /DNA_START=18 /DNA_END=1301 /DNA_ORIENTATION=+
MKPKKPPIAAKVAAVKRAKHGDAGIEAFVQNLVRGQLSVSQWIILAGLIVAAIAVAVGLHLLFGSKVRALSPTDSAALKQVFFSGEPWLIECSTSRSASALLYEAEGKLGSSIKTATLDCGAALPSGKTTLERFKLTPSKRDPVFLLAANLERPVVAKREVLNSGETLAKWATQVSKPRLLSASSSFIFDQQCLKRRWCALVITANTRLPTEERKVLMSIAAFSRLVRFVSLDVSKFVLNLDLPGGVPQPNTGRSTLLLLKQIGDAKGGADGKEPSTAAMLLESGLDDARASLAGIDAAMSSAPSDDAVPEGFTQLLKRPSVVSRLPPPDPPRARPTPDEGNSFEERRQSWKTGEPVSRTLTDEELQAMRSERAAELQALEKEREQQRRAQMAEEEQQAGNLEREEEEDDGEAEADTAEEEVESMEL